jgi:hypothetical protein
MQLRPLKSRELRRTYESSPAKNVSKAMDNLSIIWYRYKKKKEYISDFSHKFMNSEFSHNFMRLMLRFEFDYMLSFVECDTYTSTMKDKMDTSVSAKKLYSYANKHQLHISYLLQDQKDYKLLYQRVIMLLTKAAKEFEKKMNDHYEKETQKTLTRSMKKRVSELKTVFEETKTELHKWCEYSEKC